MRCGKLPVEALNKICEGRNASRTLATVCVRKASAFPLDAERDIFFEFRQYDAAVYRDILQQADAWAVKTERTEEWDPYLYDTGKVTEEKIAAIASGEILVKDGAFAGLVGCAANGGEAYLYCALLCDHTGEPLPFTEASGFGSSDRDMLYRVRSWLVRKAVTV